MLTARELLPEAAAAGLSVSDISRVARISRGARWSTCDSTRVGGGELLHGP